MSTKLTPGLRLGKLRHLFGHSDQKRIDVERCCSINRPGKIITRPQNPDTGPNRKDVIDDGFNIFDDLRQQICLSCFARPLSLTNGFLPVVCSRAHLHNGHIRPFIKPCGNFSRVRLGLAIIAVVSWKGAASTNISVCPFSCRTSCNSGATGAAQLSPITRMRSACSGVVQIRRRKQRPGSQELVDRCHPEFHFDSSIQVMTLKIYRACCCHWSNDSHNGTLSSEIRWIGISPEMPSEVIA